MRQDLRDALRALRRAPAFSVVAIVLLALAIGSATATFSVVDAILVRGLPYANASRLQTVYERSDDGSLRVPSFPTFKDWQDNAAAVRDAIDGFAFVRGNGVEIGTAGEPEQQIDAYVTPDFFQLMGMPVPRSGARFSPDEERPGAPRVAVDLARLLHAPIRRRRERRARQDDHRRQHPDDDHRRDAARLRVSEFRRRSAGCRPRCGNRSPCSTRRTRALRLRGLHVDSRALLRLRERRRLGASRGRDAHDSAASRAEYPVEQAHWTSITIHGLSEELFGAARIHADADLRGDPARAAARVRERRESASRPKQRARARARGSFRARRRRMATRASSARPKPASSPSWPASPAPRSAPRSCRFLRPYAAQRFRSPPTSRSMARTLFFVFGVSALTALAHRRAARDALARSRSRHAPARRAGRRHRGRRASRAQRPHRGAILAGDHGAGRGGTAHSKRAPRVERRPRLRHEGVVVIHGVSAGGKVRRARSRRPRSIAASSTRRAPIPSVEASAVAGGALLPTKLETDDRPTAGAGSEVGLPSDLDGLLKIYRLRIVDGRGFTDDDMRSPSGFLITRNSGETICGPARARSDIESPFTDRRKHAPTSAQPITLPIVGVVADYRAVRREAKPPEQVFLPYTLEVWPWMLFDRARAADRCDARRDRERGEGRRSGDRPAGKAVGASTARSSAAFTDPRVFVTTLMSGFAATALLLAAIGLYGVMAYGVAQRTREIGVRIAIGATSRSIVTLVLGQAAVLVAVGVVAGLARGRRVDATLVRALLFETTPTDVATFSLVPARARGGRSGRERGAGVSRDADGSDHRDPRRVGRTSTERR